MRPFLRGIVIWVRSLGLGGGAFALLSAFNADRWHPMHPDAAAFFLILLTTELVFVIRGVSYPRDEKYRRSSP